MAKEKELYRILELDESATDAQITDSYNRLSAGLPDSSIEKQRLDLAYSVLSDIDRRAHYDITGKTSTRRLTKRRKVQSGKMTDIRRTLNFLFLIGAAVSAILFVLQYCGVSTTPFYWACSISLVLKVVEYFLRLIP
ncbi:MAG: J domain-containing protein [Bacteroidaceae bacterium]|nr:J domain-containing protein [Bacteroidaceae bacterium]